MRKLILIGLLINASRTEICAQPSNNQIGEPVVGQSCPDINFTDVIFYKKRKVTLADFRGKWLILDFWDKNCSSCIGNFPRINEEQVEFKDSIQYLMITYRDKEDMNRSIYTNYRNKLNLQMPCAFDGINGESGIFKQFNVGFLPHTIVVDPNGIVRVITGKIPKEKLRILLHGEMPVFNEASYADGREEKGKFKYDAKAPFLVNGNGGVDSIYLYRSLLSRWMTGNPKFEVSEGLIHSKREMKYFFHEQGRFEEIGVELKYLYRAAYLGKTFDYFIEHDTSLYGKFWPDPILEMKDTTPFTADYASGKNVFCYSLTVPPSKATEPYMMQIMRSDLENYFGYQVSVEMREMPYWRLTAVSDDAKNNIRTKGGTTIDSENNRPWQECLLRNCTMSRLMDNIAGYSNVTDDGTPFLDETGIKFNIDIDLEMTKGDLKGIQQTLLKKGLCLFKGMKKMKVLIIKDSIQ